MHFKELEIAGFKSFADRIEIKFDNGITAIVGPNGCGKSNVADAIRWVLGEQSSKLLRGSSMQDVIFNGTEKRKSLSFAEVTLLFDNSDGFFRYDYNELAVTRKLYRSGESEYMLNRTPCRLKDIIDLLYDSGLGRDGYSIIGQGKVDEIISSKPEQRRAIFEEASGISKFKSRKVEAERKLERTLDNLTRLRDIIAEIERQIEPLARQSEVAKKYLTIKEQLKDLEINAYIFQHQNASEMKQKLQARLQAVLEEEALLQQKLDSTIHQYGVSMAEVAEIDRAINRFHTDVLNLTVGIEKQSSEIKLIRERIGYLKEQNERVSSDIERSEHDIAKAQTDLAAKHTLIDQKTVELSDLKTKSDNLAKDYLKVIDQLALSEDQAEENQRNMIDFMEKISSIKANFSSLEAEQKMLTTMQKEQKQELSALETKLQTQNANQASSLAIISEKQALLQQKQAQISEAEAERQTLISKQKQALEDKHGISSKIQVFENRKRLLEEMQAEFEGYASSVKRLLRDAERNSGLKSKIVGVVAALLSVPEQFETAIEVALGGAVQNIVTFNEQGAQDLIAYLKQTQSGRATFLPITSMRPRSLSAFERGSLSLNGCLGVASELVSFDKQIEPVVSNLLGGTVIVNNLETAVKLAKNNGYSFKIVTLEGDVVNPQGSLTGGSKKSEATNLISRDREIETLGKEVIKLKNEFASITNLIAQLQNSFVQNESTTASLNKEKTHAEIALAKENEKLASIQSLIADYEKQIALSSNSLEQIAKKQEVISKQISSVNELEENANLSINTANSNSQARSEASSELKTKKEEYNAEATSLKVQIAQLEGEIASLNSDVSRLEQALQQLEKSLAEAKSVYSRNNQTIIGAENIIETQLQTPQSDDAKHQLDKIKRQQNEVEQRKAALQTELQQLEEKRNQITAQISNVQNKKLSEEVALSKVDTDSEVLRQRIEEEYELDYNSCLAYKREVFVLEKGLAEISKLKNAIVRLGNVNVNAIEDYKLLHERHSGLFEQAEDLTKAQEDLVAIIRELSGEMTTRFEAEFKKINENFKKTFKELFGGGNARLELTSPDNLLDTGVEIFAEPPGKKLQSITLLSGGEKALTAIAILFAILKLKPMPFCLLDEIEAALDDANAERFAQYLRRFSNETQFIVITHRKPTMELADSLFGVTMEEKGVSKMVSVKLAEAVKTVEAVS